MYIGDDQFGILMNYYSQLYNKIFCVNQHSKTHFSPSLHNFIPLSQIQLCTNIQQKIHIIRNIIMNTKTIHTNTIMNKIYKDAFGWDQHTITAGNITLFNLRFAAACIILSVSKDVLELPEKLLHDMCRNMFPSLHITTLYKPNKFFLSNIKSLMTQNESFYSINDIKCMVCGVPNYITTHKITAQFLKRVYGNFYDFYQDEVIGSLDYYLPSDAKTIVMHQCALNTIDYNKYNSKTISILINYLLNNAPAPAESLYDVIHLQEYTPSIFDTDDPPPFQPYAYLGLV